MQSDTHLHHKIFICILIFFQDLNETFVAHYPLSGGVHTIATVPPTKTVFLWLGVRILNIINN